MNIKIPFVVMPLTSLGITCGALMYATRVVQHARAQDRAAHVLMATACDRAAVLEGTLTQRLRRIDASTWSGSISWSGNNTDQFVVTGFCDSWSTKGLDVSAALQEIERHLALPDVAPKTC